MFRPCPVCGCARRWVRARPVQPGAEARGRAARCCVTSATDVTAHIGPRSCLVLAPHPDDETLGAGATIMRKVDAGTAGAPGGGHRRQQVAGGRPRRGDRPAQRASWRAAMRVLGLGPATSPACRSSTPSSAGTRTPWSAPSPRWSAPSGPTRCWSPPRTTPTSDHAVLGRGHPPGPGRDGGALARLPHLAVRAARPPGATAAAVGRAPSSCAPTGYRERKRRAVAAYAVPDGG